MSTQFTFAMYQREHKLGVAEALAALESDILSGKVERWGYGFRYVKRWLVCVKRGKRRDDPAEFYEFKSDRAATRFMRACEMQGCVCAVTEQ